MMNKPLVNIVVTTFNRISYNKQSIPNIKETASSDIPFCLTIVDNGSTDGTVDLLREQYEAGIIDNLILLKENVGVAKAQNLGWKLFEDDCDYYLKSDNDILYKKKNWLNGLVFTCRKIPQIGALGYTCEETEYPVVGNTVVKIRIKRGNIGGACFFVPKHIWDKLGYWEESFGLYGEEDAIKGAQIAAAGFINAYMVDDDMIDHLPEHCPKYRKFKDVEREDNLKRDSNFWRIIGEYQKGNIIKTAATPLENYDFEYFSHFRKR